MRRPKVLVTDPRDSGSYNRPNQRQLRMDGGVYSNSLVPVLCPVVSAVSRSDTARLPRPPFQSSLPRLVGVCLVDLGDRHPPWRGALHGGVDLAHCPRRSWALTP